MTRLRILLVEDEPLIAMMLEDFLEMLDYEMVGHADNVAAGLDAVAAGGFDAAILDVHLRDGEASWPIADLLADRALPFLLATGGHIAPPPARHAVAPTLAKPFTMDGVDAALRRLLARRPERLKDASSP